MLGAIQHSVNAADTQLSPQACFALMTSASADAVVINPPLPFAHALLQVRVALLGLLAWAHFSQPTRVHLGANGARGDPTP